MAGVLLDLISKGELSFYIHFLIFYTFLVLTENFIIHVDVQNHTVEAVLHYAGASNLNEPTTVRRICTKENQKDKLSFCILPKRQKYKLHFNIGNEEY